MVRSMAGALAVASLVVVCMGCSVPQGQLKDMTARMDANAAQITELGKRIDGLEGALKQAQDADAQKLDQTSADLGKRIDQVAASIADTQKALEAAQAQSVAASKAMEDVQVKVDAFRQQLSDLTIATSGAQQVLVRNLETALAIYKQQYVAIQEAVERLKLEGAEATGAAGAAAAAAAGTPPAPMKPAPAPQPQPQPQP